MAEHVSRRSFVKETMLASAGAAMALGGTSVSAKAAAPASPPAPQPGLPKGKIGEMEISRILLGGNLLTHFTHGRDLRYTYNLAKHYNTEEKIFETMALAEAQGINTLVIHTAPNVLSMLKKYREKQGGKIQCIMCSTVPLDDVAKFGQSIQQMIDAGVDAIYIWGVQADAVTAQGKPELIAKAVEMVKSQDMLCGVGGHELAVVQECERLKVPADFYVKTFHHHNYPSAKLNFDSMWCKEPEQTRDLFRGITKPWIAFKVMAAGAIPPEDAFKFVFDNGADFSLAGMFDFEIAEDVAIAKRVLAAVKTRARPWCG